MAGSNSQHSSPATFSTSTAASVLETPPVGQQLPQLAYTPQFDMPAGQHQQQFTGYEFSDTAATPKATDGDGDLGLTIVDPGYTFPPPAPRAASPTKRSASAKWPKTQAAKTPYSTSGRKVPRLQMSGDNANSDAPSPYPSAPSPFPPTPSSALSPPSLVSPTPITPIPMYLGQPGMHQLGMDDLGVELNLNLPPGVDVGQMDPEHLGGLLEYAFPQQGHEYITSGGLLQDGYSLGGLAAGAQSGNALLGDVALGVHEEQEFDPQQQFLPVDGNYDIMSPLSVPIYENGAAPFDPTVFVNDPNAPLGVDEEVNLSAATADEMASGNNLEFQMMEWRRSSGSGQGQGAPDMGRRASISTGPSLYGFNAEQGQAYNGQEQQDAPTPRNNYEVQGQPTQPPMQGMNVGWDFEFVEPQQDFNAGPGAFQQPYGGQMYPQQNFYAPGPVAPHHQLNLETVQERSSSEEADERRYHDTWVSSSA